MTEEKSHYTRPSTSGGRLRSLCPAAPPRSGSAAFVITPLMHPVRSNAEAIALAFALCSPMPSLVLPLVAPARPAAF